MFIHVQFVDLTTTIYVKRGLMESSTKLRDVIDFFTDKWEYEKITLNGKPVRPEEFDNTIELVCKEHWVIGDMSLQIEKHR